MITVGSLFSGIGGFELGLERTGSFKTIWQCENDAYAGAVLKKHWPAIPNLGDITKVDWQDVERPDLICGGFPCQDISNAGKKAGIKEGNRSGLWFEFHKALRSLRPEYALVENVAAIANEGLDIVLSGLAEIGYDAEWFVIRASDVGAPHKRERLFIVAYRNKQRIGRRQPQPRDGKRTDVTDAYTNGLERWKQQGCWEAQRQDDNIAELVACKTAECCFQSWGQNEFSEAEVFRVDDGIPNYVDRIKCLGNAVVPQVAQVIGEAILEKRGGV